MLLSMAASLLVAAHAHAQQEPIAFDIQAQDLGAALKEFAAVTNIEILFSPELVKDRRAAAVSGRLAPADALLMLLANSGLTFDEVAPNVFVVKAKDSTSGVFSRESGLQVAGMAVAPGAGTAEHAPRAAAAAGAVGIITGRATDAATGAPLAGAIVRVKGTSFSAATDAQGLYRIPAIPAGEYEIETTYLGSGMKTAHVQVNAGEQVTQDFVFGNVTEVVVVRGNRSAMAQALNQQRAALNSSTVVAADLLGTFPAETVSEALRRVSGVTFARDDETGEGAKVAVRGFSAEAINIKLNGLDLQGTGFQRSIDLSSFLADNISQITIQKSLLPSQEATGSGGLVEIETRSGLDYGDRYFSAAVEQEWTLDDGFGDEPQASVTAAWKFAPGFGVAANVQYRETDRRSWDVATIATLPNVLPAGYTSVFNVPERFNFPFDPEFDGQLLSGANYIQRDIESSNLTASLNFAWDLGTHTSLRLDMQQSSLESLLTTSRATHSFITGSFDMPIPELGGEVRRRTVLNSLRPAMELMESDTEGELRTISFRGKTELDRWEFGYKLGYSSAVSRSRNHRINLLGATATNLVDLIDPATIVRHPDDDAAGTLRVVDGGVLVTGDHIPVLSLTPQGYAFLADPATYTVSNASRSFTDDDTDVLIGQLSGRFNFSSDVLRYVEIGAKYDSADRTSSDDDFIAHERFAQASETWSAISSRPTFIGDVVADPFGAMDLSVIGSSGQARYLRPDVASSVFDQLVRLAQDDPSTPQNEARFNYANAGARDITQEGALLPVGTEEKRLATYLEMMVKLGRLDLVGGARYERTDRQSVAVSVPQITLDVPGTVREPRETFANAGLVDFVAIDGAQHTLTPSLLATWRHNENLVFRLGYFRSTVHPDLRVLRRSPQLFIDLREATAHATIREANPDIKPTKTDNYDLDITWYFTENPGLVRGSVFIKDVSNNFTNILSVDNPNDSVRERVLEMLAPLQATRPDLLAIPENAEYRLNRPENGEGGRIWGVELEVIRQLDFLPGIWSDLSVLANVTYTDGNVPTEVSARNDAGEAVTISIDRALKDQSAWSGTASIGYERGAFSGRLIYTVQSESVLEFDEHNINTVVPKVSTLDLRLSYGFRNPLGYLTVFLEGDDLLHGPHDADVRTGIGSTFGEGSPDFFFPRTVQFRGGRTLTLGVKATF